MFDGKTAAEQKKNRTDDEKNFGIQIDSLCDVVCFWYFSRNDLLLSGWNTPADWGAYFYMASVIRLAYFNVFAAKETEFISENRQYYQGLPTIHMIILPFLYLMRRYCGLISDRDNILQ